MITPKYKTNLTEQQYKSQEGRHRAFSKIIVKRFENKEITLEEARKLSFDYAKKLGLVIDKEEESHPIIVNSEEIFDKNIKDKYTRFEEKRLYKKIHELEIPKHFITVEERDAPCQIVKNPNVKNIMKGTIDYANRVGREVHYSLCQTPKGVKVSSPSFGGKTSVTRRKERTLEKCTHEFGKGSEEIGEFHTHPGINVSEFSVADLLSFSWHDKAQNIGDSRCVVSKVQTKKGEEKTRVRCTTSSDVTRYLDSIKYEGMDRKYKGLPNILYNEEAKRKLSQRFGRDPDIQNAFTCTVDIDGTKSTNKKLFRNDYSEEYDGKVISKERIKLSKKQIKKTQRKTFKKSSSTQESSGFLGLGNFV